MHRLDSTPFFVGNQEHELQLMRCRRCYTAVRTGHDRKLPTEVILLGFVIESWIPYFTETGIGFGWNENSDRQLTPADLATKFLFSHITDAILLRILMHSLHAAPLHLAAVISRLKSLRLPAAVSSPVAFTTHHCLCSKMKK